MWRNLLNGSSPFALNAMVSHATAAAPAQGSSPASQAAQQRQANMQARQIIVQNAVDLVQSIWSNTLNAYTAGQALTQNIPVRNVGLIKRFWTEFLVNVQQGAAETQTKTTFGNANLCSQIVVTDLNNQVRISTSGWHLHFLATVRRQLAFGAAFTNSDSTGIGQNWGIMVTPSPVTTAQNARWWYELPISYSDTDLSGAIWANVLNATMNIQITINGNYYVASGADPTLAAYQSSSAQLGKINSIALTVYQNALDQLPVNQKTGQVILPPLDLEYVYLLNNTNSTGLQPNQAQALPYANWRNFLSTFIIYDNSGTLNIGTDVANVQLQSANFTNIFQKDPFQLALETRTLINDDFAAGVYYIPSRNKPINTLQYGNMQINFTPSAVTNSATAQLLVGYESLALQGVMNQAGSIFQS
jgi:P3 major capsid protein